MRSESRLSLAAEHQTQNVSSPLMGAFRYPKTFLRPSKGSHIEVRPSKGFSLRRTPHDSRRVVVPARSRKAMRYIDQPAQRTLLGTQKTGSHNLKRLAAVSSTRQTNSRRESEPKGYT